MPESKHLSRRQPGEVAEPGARSQKAPRSPRLSAAERARRDRSLGYIIKAAHRAFTRALQDRLRPHGVTLAQWYFLRELWTEDGLTQRELSHRVDVSEPTTATAINLMVRRKLVERRRANGDRRTFYIHLTPRGEALRQSLLSDGLRVNLDAARGLPERDIAKLKTLLVQMIANLERLPGAEPPA